MQMRMRRVSRTWLSAFLLIVFVAGCGRERGALAPALTLISPNNASQGQTVVVTLTGTSFATGATVGLSGAGITVSNTTVVSSTQITATFAIAANAALGPQNVIVTSSGIATSAQVFTVNLLPPTVSFTNPASGAAGVLLNRKITATFSKPMNGATLTTGTFTLMRGVNTIPGAVTYDVTNNTATFTPAVSLPINTSFTAMITAGATDTLGHPLVSGGSAPNPWSFSTGATADATSPTVSATNPANGATSVPTNLKITATFSEPMDSSTITAATFTVQRGVTPVSGSVTYAGSTATFTPTSNLAASATFTATITAGAKETWQAMRLGKWRPRTESLDIYYRYGSGQHRADDYVHKPGPRKWRLGCTGKQSG